MKKTSLLSALSLLGSVLSFPAFAQDSAGGSWVYGEDGSGEATRISASIAGQVDDGSSSTLTFFSNELTGRQAHLELPFPPDCETGCRAALSVDGGPADQVRATILPTADNILSFRGARDIWRSLDDADGLEIAFTDAEGHERKAIFAVSGLDLSALPGWQ